MGRVVVNAVSARRGGARRHLIPFIEGLGQMVGDRRVHALVPPDLDWPHHLQASRTIARLPPGINLRRLVWDQVRVPAMLRGKDVLVSPLNFGPAFSPCPHILFQRNPIYFDTRLWPRLDHREAASVRRHRRVAIALSQRADCTVVPSHAMRDLLVESGIDAEQIHVVHHGFSVKEARSLAAQPVPPGATAWATASGPRLLSIAGPAPHKNLNLMVDALSRLTREHNSGQLAVTFSETDTHIPAARRFIEHVQRSKLRDRVHYLGHIPQEQVYSLYTAADVFLFPSITESFGFPLLEAIAVGVPLVISDIPSNREIAGDAAYYHGVDDAEELADAIDLACQSSGATKPDDIEQRFTWRRHCRKIADLIEAIT